MEYYHADRLNYAVAGTPNRLEYDQGFFVKQGDGAADFKPIAHLYKTQVYALAEHLGVPGTRSASGRPPPTPSRCRRRRKSSTSRCPTTRWTCACTRYNHGVPAAEVAAGARTSRRSRSSASTATSRRSAARRGYLHAPPLLVEPVVGGLSPDVRHRGHRRTRRRPAAARARRARGDGRGAPPSRARRIRRLPRRPRGPRATRGCRSSTSPPASSRCPTRTTRCGSSSTARSSTTSSCATELDARGHRFRTQQRHRGHRPRLRGVGRGALRALQRSVGHRALGRRARATLVLARDPLGVRPLYLCEHAGRLLLRQRGQGDLRRRPVDPARARPGRARRDLHLLDRSSRRRRSSRAIDRAEPGPPCGS